MRVSYGVGAGLILCSIAAGLACADEEWTNTRDSYICRSSNEVLEIKTYVSNASADGHEQGPECRVDYIRNGVTRTLWSSHTSRSYCNGKASSLVAKFRSGIFSCEPLHLQGKDSE